MLSSKINTHPTYFDNRGCLGILEHNIHNISWDRTITAYNEKKYTFRGMHYQNPNPQVKYIKVIRGSIVDFLYNLDTHEVERYELNVDNSLLVPYNYAHGYLTLEPNTIVTYLISGDYIPSNEKIISYHGIDKISSELSSLNNITISNKDLFRNP